MSEIPQQVVEQAELDKHIKLATSSREVLVAVDKMTCAMFGHKLAGKFLPFSDAIGMQCHCGAKVRKI